LDSLVNLKKLSLVGNKNWNFNLKLFENLCKQLENIKISICNIEENDFLKLFDGCNFIYLEEFTIESLYMTRLKKEFIDRLPKPKKLNINTCGIEVIESDLFSNMQQLSWLDLSNNRIEYIVENGFSSLKNLQTLNLKGNIVRKRDLTYIVLEKSVDLKLDTTPYQFNF